jgi:type II secretory pathway pseudopilin PulG
MKPIIKQSGKEAAFTIVELLTVMSIIVILIGLLVPALNRVKRYAKEVKQKAQFHSIDVAMELFNTQWDGYPDSDAFDGDNEHYCGAMKLCEAMMGQDLLGFHPSSHFLRAGTDGVGGTQLYPDEGDVTPDEYAENLKTRRGPYLQLENANAYTLTSLYGSDTNPFTDPNTLFVLCDVYSRRMNTGNKTGMPILYYRADTSKTTHDTGDADNPDNIYDYFDNDELVGLKMPWDDTGADHTIYGTNNPEQFYEDTLNEKITTTKRPYRSDSYILLSAGFDGEYGTPDDIFNFEQ